MERIGPEALLIAATFGNHRGLEEYRRLEYPSETAASIVRSTRGLAGPRPGGSSVGKFVGRIRVLARAFSSLGSFRAPDAEASGARGGSHSPRETLPLPLYPSVVPVEAVPSVSLVGQGARADPRSSGEGMAHRAARGTKEFRALTETGTAAEPCPA